MMKKGELMQKIMHRIYTVCLVILEKVDARNTAFKRVTHKVTRKVYDKAFYAAFGVSAYDYDYDWSQKW